MRTGEQDKRRGWAGAQQKKVLSREEQSRLGQARFQAFALWPMPCAAWSCPETLTAHNKKKAFNLELRVP